MMRMSDKDPLPRVWTPGVCADLWMVLIGSALFVTGMVKEWGVEGMFWQSLVFGVGCGGMAILFGYRAGNKVEEHLIQRKLWFMRNVESLRHPERAGVGS